ncbi:MAG TPA: hypothetical protein VN648_10175, partial [Candidatus Methylomirabilis sp.]|nr:hypothetical protein [Candidatus Methylomirabilis sp.]
MASRTRAFGCPRKARGKLAGSASSSISAVTQIAARGRAFRETVFWRQFRRNQLALAGGMVVLCLSLAAVFAPWLAPYDPA